MENVQSQVVEGVTQDEPGSITASPRLSRKDRAFYANVTSVLHAARPVVTRLRQLQSNDLRSAPAFKQAMHGHIVQYAAFEASNQMREKMQRPALIAMIGIPFLFFDNPTLQSVISSLPSAQRLLITFALVVSYLIITLASMHLLKRFPAFNAAATFHIPDIPWQRIQRERDQEKKMPAPQFDSFIILIPMVTVLVFRVAIDTFINSLVSSGEYLQFLLGLSDDPSTLYTSGWFWYAVVILLSVLAIIPPYASRRRFNSRHPQTVVCIQFLEALSLIEQFPDAWKVASFKKVIVSKLEEAALRMEYDVPRQLRARDPATDAWLAQSFTGIARSIREQKKGMLLQQPEARAALLNYLIQELPQAALGDLGNMARIEDPSPVSRRQGMLGKLGRLIESLLKGGLPLLGLWLVQQSDYRIQGEWINTVFIGLIFYLIVSILREFDPTYTDKIGAVKDLITFTSKE